MKIKMMNKESRKALNFYQLEALKAAYAENFKQIVQKVESKHLFGN